MSPGTGKGGSDLPFREAAHPNLKQNALVASGPTEFHRRLLQHLNLPAMERNRHRQALTGYLGPFGEGEFGLFGLFGPVGLP